MSSPRTSVENWFTVSGWVAGRRIAMRDYDRVSRGPEQLPRGTYTFGSARCNLEETAGACAWVRVQHMSRPQRSTQCRYTRQRDTPDSAAAAPEAIRRERERERPYIYSAVDDRWAADVHATSNNTRNPILGRHRNSFISCCYVLGTRAYPCIYIYICIYLTHNIHYIIQFTRVGYLWFHRVVINCYYPSSSTSSPTLLLFALLRGMRLARISINNKSRARVCVAFLRFGTAIWPTRRSASIFFILMYPFFFFFILNVPATRINKTRVSRRHHRGRRRNDDDDDNATRCEDDRRAQ